MATATRYAQLVASDPLVELRLRSAPDRSMVKLSENVGRNSVTPERARRRMHHRVQLHTQMRWRRSRSPVTTDSNLKLVKVAEVLLLVKQPDRLGGLLIRRPSRHPGETVDDVPLSLFSAEAGGPSASAWHEERRVPAWRGSDSCRAALGGPHSQGSPPAPQQ